MTGVAVSSLCASYGRVQVLFDVDLSVAPGETIVVLGSNGAGKSTLLDVMSGLLAPSSGRVEVGGQDVTSWGAERRVCHGLSHLRGGAATFGPLTITENLEAAAHPYRGDDRRRRLEAALDRFPELADHAGRRAEGLSGGQTQMLALSMALVHEPEVLLVDELSLGLAPLVVERVLEGIRALQESGTTMVVVEQSLNVAASFSDRAVVIDRGRVRFDGATTDLLHGDLAASMFLGA